MTALARGIVGLALLLFLCPPVSAAPADDVKNLLDQGRPADAYTLGRNHPGELGKPAFDFYFGIAAVGSGHAGEGVLALERYVVNVPEDINGRLELARGYFVLGEDARAREEFETALAAKPPADVQANVQRFLDAIRARESQYRPSASYALEAGYGYDSNASGGPGGTSLVLPNGVGVTISDRFSRSSDNFLHLLASASGTRPLSPGVSLFGLASIDARTYDTESRFGQYNLGASGGLTLLREKNFFRGTVSLNRLILENDLYRDVTSVSGEWQHQLDELQAVNAFVQVSDLDYAGTNSLRNSNFYTVGGGYRRAFIHPWQPLVRANLYLGREDVRSNARSDLARDVYGARFAASFTPLPKWAVSLGVTYQKSDYAGGDPLPAGISGLACEKRRLLGFGRQRQLLADAAAQRAGRVGSVQKRFQ